MAKPPSQLTDSQKDLAAIVGAAVAARDKAKGTAEDDGPHGSTESSEKIRWIARDEAQRTCKEMIGEYQTWCVNEGPICGVWNEVNKMKDGMKVIEVQAADERGEARGILKAQARQVTLIVAGGTLLGIAAQFAFGLYRSRHGG